MRPRDDAHGFVDGRTAEVKDLLLQDVVEQLGPRAREVEMAPLTLFSGEHSLCSWPSDDAGHLLHFRGQASYKKHRIRLEAVQVNTLEVVV